MSHQTVPAFWKALEAVPPRGALLVDWQRLLGDEFELVLPWLRPNGDLAGVYPSARGQARVVEEGNDSFVAVCPVAGRAFPVNREALAIWEVDWSRLLKVVCAALDLRPSGKLLSPQAAGEIIAWQTRRDVDLPVLFVRPARLRDIERTLLQYGAAFPDGLLLLTPTGRWRSGEIFQSPLFKEVAWWTLEDRLLFSADGFTPRALSRTLSASPTLGQAKDAVFCRRGDAWEVRFRGVTVWLEPSQGAAYLAQLLASPGRTWPAVELWAQIAQVDNRLAQGTRGAAADREALQAYKARLAELETDLQTARELGSAHREEMIADEISQLLEQLHAASSLAGRPRDLSDRERARKRVGNALRRLLERLETMHAPLARHLDQALRLGSSLAYEPSDKTEWDVLAGK